MYLNDLKPNLKFVVVTNIHILSSKMISFLVFSVVPKGLAWIVHFAANFLFAIHAEEIPSPRLFWSPIHQASIVCKTLE